MLMRLAQVHESGQIAAVLRRAFSEFEPLYTPRAYALTTPKPAQVQRRWTEGPVWVAVLHDRIAGTVSAVPSGDSLYIRSMAVLPAAQGCGMGRSLLEQVERFAREKSFRRMRLSTTPFLLAAIQLYQSSGFTKNAEGPHDLAGTPLFTMEKPIVPLQKREDENEKLPGKIDVR